MSEQLTKKEFMKEPEMKELSRNAVVCAWVMYACAAITCVLLVFVQKNIFALIDVALVAGLAFGVHKFYSRGCAVAVTAYALFNFIVMIATTGKAGGNILAIAAICAVIYTFQIHKCYKKYLETGEIEAPKKNK